MTAGVVKTTYIAYLHRGSFVAEESVDTVAARDPRQQANEAPRSAFAFFYFDIVTTWVNVDGERIETRSGRRKISKTYYIDGQLLDCEAVSALPGDNDVLLRNMLGNRWDYVVHCRTGGFQPFIPKDHELVTTR